MKLLFDQNLSPRLVKLVRDLFPGSEHVYRIRMDTADDRTVREFAAVHDFIVVTKDADYGELFSLFGGPPKVLWIRRGNCSTNTVEHIIRGHFRNIKALESHASAGVLTIY